MQHRASPRGAALDDALTRQLGELVQRQVGAPARAFETVPAGLGTRRFVRIHVDDPARTTLIARIEAPEDPAIRPAGIPPEPRLEPLRSFFEASGIPVPRSFGSDPVLGVDLLEDLGSENLAHALAASDSERGHLLVQEACRWIPEFQRLERAPNIEAFDRHLDHRLFRYKAEQVIEWVLPRVLSSQQSNSAADVVREAFDYVAQHAAAAPQRLAHRDYQSTNILLRPGSPPGSELAIIDFQGAFMAPPEYDLVCLLRDPHANIADAWVEEQLQQVRPLLPEPPAADVFELRFNLLTLSRCGKDLARHLYAADVHGETRFQHLQAPLGQSLKRASNAVSSTESVLANLAEIFERLETS